MIVKRESVNATTMPPLEPGARTYIVGHPSRLCRFAGRVCSNPRAIKRNGTLDRHCETHAAQATNAQRKQQQRDRLLRYLVNALRPEDPSSTDQSTSDGNTRPRQRPRLVLLGNQQTLILGVVLSDRSSGADLVGLRP